jgi:hypothetical protein
MTIPIGNVFTTVIAIAIVTVVPIVIPFPLMDVEESA